SYCYLIKSNNTLILTLINKKIDEHTDFMGG
ncbi:MAG: hypothetical protein ACI9H1_001471, partial [Polaribacter sp.]